MPATLVDAASRHRPRHARLRPPRPPDAGERPPEASIDAVILAGGRAHRLVGADKAALIGPDGRTALRTVLDAGAAVGARRLVVVGPPTLTSLLGPYEGWATVVQEDPPWSGPARGIAAGVAALPPEGRAVLVLACDMPNIAPAVRVLARRGLARDGVVARASGRRQWLLGLYRRDVLAAACARLARPVAGARDPSVRELVGSLDLVDVLVPNETADDVDTPADLNRLHFSLA